MSVKAKVAERAGDDAARTRRESGEARRDGEGGGSWCATFGDANEWGGSGVRFEMGVTKTLNMVRVS